MSKIEVVLTKEYPVCPYCEKEIKGILKNMELKSYFGSISTTVYMCPNCKKILPVCGQ